MNTVSLHSRSFIFTVGLSFFFWENATLYSKYRKKNNKVRVVNTVYLTAW